MPAPVSSASLQSSAPGEWKKYLSMYVNAKVDEKWRQIFWNETQSSDESRQLKRKEEGIEKEGAKSDLL